VPGLTTDPTPGAGLLYNQHLTIRLGHASSTVTTSETLGVSYPGNYKSGETPIVVCNQPNYTIGGGIAASTDIVPFPIMPNFRWNGTDPVIVDITMSAAPTPAPSPGIRMRCVTFTAGVTPVTTGRLIHNPGNVPGLNATVPSPPNPYALWAPMSWNWDGDATDSTNPALTAGAITVNTVRNTSAVPYGIYNHTTFSVAAGVTLTAQGAYPLRINASSGVRIDGTINVSGSNGLDGGSAGARLGGAGGASGAGCGIVDLAAGATAITAGGKGGDGAASSGGLTSGTNGGAAFQGIYQATGKADGAGGGGLKSNDGNSGGGGAGGTAGVAAALADTSLNGFGGDPFWGTPTVFDLHRLHAGGGGGGGGGGIHASAGGAGGGGGGGGAVLIESNGTIRITQNGMITADGGIGGNPETATNAKGGAGGGGGGGGVMLRAGAVINAGQISAKGGKGGTANAPSGSGGKGGDGLIVVVGRFTNTGTTAPSSPTNPLILKPSPRHAASSATGALAYNYDITGLFVAGTSDGSPQGGNPITGGFVDTASYLVSTPRDTGVPDPNYKALTGTFTDNPAAVHYKIEVKTSDSSSVDATGTLNGAGTTAWILVDDDGSPFGGMTTAATDLIDGRRYVQFRVRIWTPSPSLTAKLDSVVIDFEY
jgi:hypothetical protein